MTNSEKLRALADWFDNYDSKCCKANFKGDQVQQDLRAMATEFEQLQQPVVVRGGDSETRSVHRHEKDLKWDDFLDTPNTPTEPLPAEGLAKTVRVDECDHNVIEGNAAYFCSKCGEIM